MGIVLANDSRHEWGFERIVAMQIKTLLPIVVLAIVTGGVACTENPLGPGPMGRLPAQGTVAVPPPPPDAPSNDGNLKGGGTVTASYQHFQGYSAINASVADRTRYGRQILRVRLYRASETTYQEFEVTLDDNGAATTGFFIQRLGKYVVRVFDLGGTEIGSVPVNVQ